MSDSHIVVYLVAGAVVLLILGVETRQRVLEAAESAAVRGVWNGVFIIYMLALFLAFSYALVHFC